MNIKKIISEMSLIFITSPSSKSVCDVTSAAVKIQASNITKYLARNLVVSAVQRMAVV